MRSKIMRNKEVQKALGISRTTIHRMVKSGEFPKPISLGKRTKVWLWDEVEEWLERKKREREE